MKKRKIIQNVYNHFKLQSIDYNVIHKKVIKIIEYLIQEAINYIISYN